MIWDGLNWRLEHGDALERLRQIPPSTIHALVTDPPAGIGFMGEAWDTFDSWPTRDRLGRAPREPSEKRASGPDLDYDYTLRGRAAFISWLTPIAVECLRVLKPGAHGIVWALPRTSHWTATAFEDAGFEIRDVVTHCFGSGFPKSTDIGKAIDRRRDDREEILKVTSAIAAARDACGLTNKAIDLVFGFNGMAGHWTSTKEQPAIPTLEQWATLKSFLHMGDELDALVSKLNDRKGQPGDAWFARETVGDHPNPASSIYGDEKSRAVKITRATSEEGAKWEGFGTGLKPASEHWILVRKPLEGTIAENAISHGTGGLNIEACRAAYVDEADRAQAVVPQAAFHRGDAMTRKPGHIGMGHGRNGETFDPGVGRWPANLVVSDDVAELFGEAARFFYTAKAGGTEKDAGLEETNEHPTVKPLDLMRWLVRLVTPPGGIVLDPFMGSGSTGCAAILEGMPFIGIEREDRFYSIARKRIEHWARHGEAALDAHRRSAKRAGLERAGQLTLWGSK